MEVVLASNHGANVLGVLDNFHFGISSQCRHPVKQLVATVAGIPHPTALSMIEVEPSHLVTPEGRGQRRPSKTESIGTWRGWKKVRMRSLRWGCSFSWDDRVANKKPLAGQSCLTPLAMRTCPLVSLANSTSVVLFFLGHETFAHGAV